MYGVENSAAQPTATLHPTAQKSENINKGSNPRQM